jgi:hypothetical protein
MIGKNLISETHMATSLKNMILSLALLTGSFYIADPLEIALKVWPEYNYNVLAQHLGFYQNEKLDVQNIQFESHSQAQRTFEKSQIDVMPSTIAELDSTNAGGLASGQIISVDDYSKGQQETPENSIRFITDKVRILSQSESDERIKKSSVLPKMASNFQNILVNNKAMAPRPQPNLNLVWNTNK